LSHVSVDGAFIITPTRETITPEEIPRIIARVGSILSNAAQAYFAVVQRNPQVLASSIVQIYEDIAAIKKMVED